MAASTANSANGFTNGKTVTVAVSGGSATWTLSTGTWPGTFVAGDQAAFGGFTNAGNNALGGFTISSVSGAVITTNAGTAVAEGPTGSIAAQDCQAAYIAAANLNSQAFSSAVASLGGYQNIYGGSTYRTLITPPGTIPVAATGTMPALDFNAPSYTTWNATGSHFVAPPITVGNQTAVFIGDDYEYTNPGGSSDSYERYGYHVYGLWVNCSGGVSYPSMWTSGKNAIEICNVENCEVHTDYFGYANNGLELTASGGFIGYNQFYFNQVWPCLHCVYFNITSAGSWSGWINENQFYGGNFDWDSEYKFPSGLTEIPKGIYIPYNASILHTADNNSFFRQSFQGDTTTNGGITYPTIAFEEDSGSN